MFQTKNPTALQSQTWILQALLELMDHMDYNKISVTEICRRAGLDRRTFYRNFESKDDVIEQYIKNLGNEYMTEFQAVSPRDKYSAALVFFCFWKRHLLFIKNMQQCFMSDFVFARFDKFTRSNQKLFIGKNDINTQTNYIYTYRIGGFWNAMVTWAANDADIPPEELASVISLA